MPSIPGVILYPVALDDADSLVRAANNARSPLAEAIDADDLTIPLEDASAFSASGFATIVDSLTDPSQIEIVRFTKSGNDLVIDASGRGQQGTDAQGFALPAYVEQRPTAGHHRTLSEVVQAIQAAIENRRPSPPGSHSGAGPMELGGEPVRG